MVTKDFFTDKRPIVTKEVLYETLSKVETFSKMTDSEKIDTADTVFGYFGFDDTIPDNRLKPDERGVFYDLEKEGILSHSEEELFISVCARRDKYGHLRSEEVKGKGWRVHYWSWNINKMRKILSDKVEDPAEFSVYNNDAVWERNQNSQ